MSILSTLLNFFRPKIEHKDKSRDIPLVPTIDIYTLYGMLYDNNVSLRKDKGISYIDVIVTLRIYPFITILLSNLKIKFTTEAVNNDKFKIHLELDNEYFYDEYVTLVKLIQCLTDTDLYSNLKHLNVKLVAQSLSNMWDGYISWKIFTGYVTYIDNVCEVYLPSNRIPHIEKLIALAKIMNIKLTSSIIIKDGSSFLYSPKVTTLTKFKITQEVDNDRNDNRVDR